MVNLDTHVLVHALEGSATDHEREVLENQAWGISDIVLWEMAKLAQLSRIKLDMQEPEVQRALSRLKVWPIDIEIAATSTRLDFRSDPADELIAATSVVHGVPLLTRDARIRASKMIRFA